jgi:DNA-3-methyladenine glycosylase II
MTAEILSHLQDVAAAEGYARLAMAINRIGPIEVAPSGHPSVAAHLYSAVVGQQLSLKAAETIRSRIHAAAAARQLDHVDLYTADHELTLRACGVSGRKARSLLAIRAAEAQGLLESEALRAIPHSERVACLSSIWGVGKWTADMIGIFHFLEADIWPEGDVTAVSVFRNHTDQVDSVTATEAFGPFRSYLARYMWLIRDSAPLSPSGEMR